MNSDAQYPARINVTCVLQKGVALENHAASEEGLLQFDEGDVILVLNDPQEVSICVNFCGTSATHSSHFLRRHGYSHVVVFINFCLLVC